jgi:hypothetical protein
MRERGCCKRASCAALQDDVPGRTKARGDAVGAGGSAKPARFVYPGAVSIAERSNDARVVAVVGLIGFASTVAFVLRLGGGPWLCKTQKIETRRE